MVSLLPSSRPASYVRSLLEGTRVDGAVMSHFFLSMMLARGFAVMAGTGTAVTKGFSPAFQATFILSQLGNGGKGGDHRGQRKVHWIRRPGASGLTSQPQFLYVSWE